MRALPLLLLLVGCLPALPDAPQIVSAAATCDDDGWTLTMAATHEAGEDAVVRAFVDAALRFVDESTGEADVVFLESNELGHGGDGWIAEPPPSTSQLDCEYGGEYLLIFVAEDREGDQAGASLITTGVDARDGR
jgi:hypothetical protein